MLLALALQQSSRPDPRAAPSETLTGCDDVKEAGRLLLSDPVCGRAQQRSVVELRHGLVGDNGGGSVSGDVTGGHVNTLRRIVERPFEFDIRRIGVNDALNLGSFVFRDAIDPGLARCARGCICNGDRVNQR